MKNKFEDYLAFCEKFETKKTTDDCYTPPAIMKVIFDYVEKMTNIPQDCYVRPFYPGGDYTKEDYTEKIVVDNPPFSMLTKIIDFYNEHNVKFFLFAPKLTINNSIFNRKTSCIVISQNIAYENGAKVATCFITNIPERPFMKYSEYLNKKIKEATPVKKKKGFIREIPDFFNATTISADKPNDTFFLDEYEYITKYKGRKIFGAGFIKRKEETKNE